MLWREQFVLCRLNIHIKETGVVYVTGYCATFPTFVNVARE